MTARTPIPTGQPEDPGRPDGPSSSGWRGTPLGWWAALAVLIVAIIVIAALLFIDDGDGGDTVARNQSVADIVDDPAAVMDERVIVTGRIDELLTDRALTIGSDLAPQDVLVLMEPTAAVRGYGVGTTGAPPLPVGDFYEPGDVVQFAGIVREFDRERMSEELGLVLNEELFAEFDGAPAVVVDRLDVATVGSLMLATAAPSPVDADGSPEGTASPAATEALDDDDTPEGTEAPADASPVVTEIPAG